jgi:hypothetical protein
VSAGTWKTEVEVVAEPDNELVDNTRQCSSTFTGTNNGKCGVAVCFAIDESSSQTAAGFALSTAFVKAVVGNISAISSEWALVFLNWH